MAKRGGIIKLPADRIEIGELTISKPITLEGRPGTIIEVTNGPIRINFQNSHPDPSSSLSKLVQSADSSSLAAKRGEVCMISECKFVFNRDSALRHLQSLDKKDLDPIGNHEST